MESLKNILGQKRQQDGGQVVIKRLQTYIEKKYRFKPEISLSARRINIYAPSAAQASILRLDWANLSQLSANDPRRIEIRLQRYSNPK